MREFPCLLWYGPPFVRGPARLRARLLAVGLCAISAGAVATAGGAETRTPLQQANALRGANANLASRARSAALDLYSLETKLTRARSQLAALQSAQARIERERTSVRARLDVAQRDVRVSQRLLALRVHVLYEQETTDPIAVVLGAQSLDEAITSLDDLNRTAQQNVQVAQQSQHAAVSLVSLSRKLAAEDARVRALAASAAQSATALEGARAARVSFIQKLEIQRRLNTAQLAQVERQAREAVARTETLIPPTASARPAEPSLPQAPAAAGGGHTLTVTATGYALGGRTATGIPVGWGVVAVDPAVIPLGTRMTIPGYGEGVAADTGSAVRGATIDLWFPTVAQALAWGRRTVTVTIH